jgi:hypothetical protein
VRAPWGQRQHTSQGGGDGGSPEWRVDDEGKERRWLVDVPRRRRGSVAGEVDDEVLQLEETGEVRDHPAKEKGVRGVELTVEGENGGDGCLKYGEGWARFGHRHR